jgi:hypothetical protein
VSTRTGRVSSDARRRDGGACATVTESERRSPADLGRPAFGWAWPDRLLPRRLGIGVRVLLRPDVCRAARTFVVGCRPPRAGCVASAVRPACGGTSVSGRLRAADRASGGGHGPLLRRWRATRRPPDGERLRTLVAKVASRSVAGRRVRPSDERLRRHRPGFGRWRVGGAFAPRYGPLRRDGPRGEVLRAGRRPGPGSRGALLSRCLAASARGAREGGRFRPAQVTLRWSRRSAVEHARFGGCASGGASGSDGVRGFARQGARFGGRAAGGASGFGGGTRRHPGSAATAVGSPRARSAGHPRTGAALGRGVR